MPCVSAPFYFLLLSNRPKTTTAKNTYTMKNFVQNGQALDVVLSADTNGGDVVVIGKIAGVAVKSGKTGDTVAVSLEGVYTLAKAGGSALGQGERLYWDATAKTVTTTATGNVQLGYAAYAAANAATEVAVLLIPA